MPARRKPTAERAELNGLKSTDPAAFNSNAEAAFVRFLCKMIGAEGPLTVREIISEAAFELNVSVETSKRYLLKHTARRAHFCFTQDGRSIDCKPHG